MAYYNKDKHLPKKKVCPFCKRKIDSIDYIALAKEIEKNSEKSYERGAERHPRYITEAGKIIPRRTSGLCVRHQIDLASAVKQARIMALLPFKAE